MNTADKPDKVDEKIGCTPGVEIDCAPVPRTYLIAYVIIAIVMLALLYWSLTLFAEHYTPFAQSNGYPTLTVLVVGTLIAFIILVYGCFLLSNTRKRDFALVILFVFFFGLFIWSLNLGRRIFYYEGEINYQGYGALYLILSLIAVLIFFSSCWRNNYKAVSCAAIPAIVWILAMLYLWWSV